MPFPFSACSTTGENSRLSQESVLVASASDSLSNLIGILVIELAGIVGTILVVDFLARMQWPLLVTSWVSLFEIRVSSIESSNFNNVSPRATKRNLIISKHGSAKYHTYKCSLVLSHRSEAHLHRRYRW